MTYRSRLLVRVFAALVVFAPAPLLAMELYVAIPENQTVTLEVEVSDSIANIKQKLQDKTGIPPDQQSLSFNGDPLSNDNMTLGDYEIPEGSTITLSVTLN